MYTVNVLKIKSCSKNACYFYFIYYYYFCLHFIKWGGLQWLFECSDGSAVTAVDERWF